MNGGILNSPEKSTQQRGLSMPMQPIHLKERAVIEIAGADARAYLHSLVTQDIMNLPAGQTCWAALLTPQGKILFDFFIHALSGEGNEERFLLDAPASRRDALITRMNMYRLRRQVTITPREDLAVAVDLAEDAAPGGAIVYADPRYAEMGTRAFLPQEAAANFTEDATAWHARRIALGLPDSDGDIGSQKLFPHEANFDCLNGVSFTKGCYVGQEVVSRMQHRTTVRNRLLPVIADAPLRTGMIITGAEKRIGEIYSTADERAIALIRLDRAAAALENGEPLKTEEGISIRITLPPWICFELPDPIRRTAQEAG